MVPLSIAWLGVTVADGLAKHSKLKVDSTFRNLRLPKILSLCAMTGAEITKVADDECSLAEDDMMLVTGAFWPPMDTVTWDGRLTTFPKPLAETVISTPPLQGASMGERPTIGDENCMEDETTTDASCTVTEAVLARPLGADGGLT